MALVCLALCWATHGMAYGQSENKTDTPAAAEPEITQYESFADFSEGHRAAMRAYSASFRAATSKQEREELFEARPNADVYLDQIETFLADASSEEAAKITRWWWHGLRGVRDAERIMDVLLEHHVEAELLTKFIPRYNKRVVSLEKAEAAFRKILEKNKFDSVRASATYSLRSVLVDKVKTLSGDEAAATEQEIKSLRDSLTNDFAEVNDLTGTPFVDRLAGEDFSATLQVGSKVPDIVGKDLDGVEFRLSDYEGKVIVLDFWGDW